MLCQSLSDRRLIFETDYAHFRKRALGEKKKNKKNALVTGEDSYSVLSGPNTITAPVNIPLAESCFNGTTDEIFYHTKHILIFTFLRDTLSSSSELPASVGDVALFIALPSLTSALKLFIHKHTFTAYSVQSTSSMVSEFLAAAGQLSRELLPLLLRALVTIRSGMDQDDAIELKERNVRAMEATLRCILGCTRLQISVAHLSPRPSALPGEPDGDDIFFSLANNLAQAFEQIIGESSSHSTSLLSSTRMFENFFISMFSDDAEDVVIQSSAPVIIVIILSDLCTALDNAQRKNFAPHFLKKCLEAVRNPSAQLTQSITELLILSAPSNPAER